MFNRLAALGEAAFLGARNLLAAGQQEFLAALHEVLLVERPRVHDFCEPAIDDDDQSRSRALFSALLGTLQSPPRRPPSTLLPSGSQSRPRYA
jgi:hypothetical protein